MVVWVEWVVIALRMYGLTEPAKARTCGSSVKSAVTIIKKSRFVDALSANENQVLFPDQRSRDPGEIDPEEI